jgi:hypothetical protein
MSRPQTLREVSLIARDEPSVFALALREFLDEFYLIIRTRMNRRAELPILPRSPATRSPTLGSGRPANTSHGARVSKCRVGRCAPITRP